MDTNQKRSDGWKVPGRVVSVVVESASEDATIVELSTKTKS